MIPAHKPAMKQLPVPEAHGRQATAISNTAETHARHLREEIRQKWLLEPGIVRPRYRMKVAAKPLGTRDRHEEPPAANSAAIPGRGRAYRGIRCQGGWGCERVVSFAHLGICKCYSKSPHPCCAARCSALSAVIGMIRARFRRPALLLPLESCDSRIADLGPKDPPWVRGTPMVTAADYVMCRYAGVWVCAAVSCRQKGGGEQIAWLTEFFTLLGQCGIRTACRLAISD